MKCGKKIGLTAGMMFAISAFAWGCASRDASFSPENPVTIEVKTYYNGAVQLAFEDAVAEFNKTTGADKGIHVQTSSSGDLSELIQSIQTEADTEEERRALPDIITCYPDMAKNLTDKDLLVSLDEYFTEKELSEYVDAYIEEGRLGEEELYVFPVAKSTELLTLNKTDWDVFARETGAELEQLSTWEGLVRTAHQYYQWSDAGTEEPNDGKAFFGRDAAANYMVTGLIQLDAYPFVVEDDKATVELDREALKKLWDCYYVPYISGYYGNYGKYRSDDMKTGNIIALVGSSSGAVFLPSQITVGDEEPYDIELLHMEVPNFEGTDPAVIQQGAGMAVTRTDDKRQEASAEFLKWFTDAEINSEFVMKSSYLPVKKEANNIQYVESMAKRRGVEWSEVIKDSLEVSFHEAENSRLCTMSVFQGSGTCRNILGNSLQEKADTDRADVVNSLGEGEMTLEEIISGFDTQERFEVWCEELQKALDEACDEK